MEIDHENTNVNMPMKTVISLIVLVSIFTFSYFQITERINNLETANELMKENGGLVKCYGLDIRGPQDVDNTINEIFQEGPLDGLVNNAAGNFISRTQDLSHRGGSQKKRD